MPSTNHNTKPGKKPKDHKPKAAAFGKKTSYPTELPSGSVVTLIRPGIQGLLKAKVLDSMDQLTNVVQSETIPKAEGRPVKVDVQALAKDPEKVSEMLGLMDKIVMHVVASPRLSAAPEDEAERDDDLFYIDYVDETDKSFIMQFALGGSADLKDFRKKTAKALGNVQPGEATADSAE